MSTVSSLASIPSAQHQGGGAVPRSIPESGRQQGIQQQGAQQQGARQGTANPSAQGAANARPTRPEAGGENGSIFRPSQSARGQQQPAARRPEGELSAEQRNRLQDLRRRDAEVRRHEQAHQAAGGALAGPANYQYVTGPDGNRYAVGGEVSIDVSTVAGDPRATIRRMEMVKRAALAPSQPSAQDRKVAQQAEQKQLEAQRELARMERAGESLPNETPAARPASPFSRADSAIAAQEAGQGEQDRRGVAAIGSTLPGQAAGAYAAVNRNAVAGDSFGGISISA